jgi:hypothetical protein
MRIERMMMKEEFEEKMGYIENRIKYMIVDGEEMMKKKKIKEVM